MRTTQARLFSPVGVVLVATVFATIYSSGYSYAQNKSAVAAKIRQTHALVLENLDLADYAGARAQLEKAVAEAEAAGLAEEMVNAKSHAMLGGVYVIGFRDQAKAIEHFKKTLAIAPAYQLEPPLDTDAIKAALAKADAELNPVITCETLRGIDHKQVTQAKEGEPVTVTFKAGLELKSGTAHIHYRAQNASQFKEAAMTPQGQCDYQGQIPGDEVTGELMYYFVSMRKDDGRFIAMRGNQKSPYPIQVQRAAPKVQELEAETRRENPDELLLGRRDKKGGGCAGCAATGHPGQDSAWLVLAVLGALTLGRRRRRLPDTH